MLVFNRYRYKTSHLENKCFWYLVNKELILCRGFAETTLFFKNLRTRMELPVDLGVVGGWEALRHLKVGTFE